MVVAPQSQRADRCREVERCPSRWLLMVVSYEQGPGRIVTALATHKDPKRWQPSRGLLRVTVPEIVEASADDMAPALSAA